MPLIVDDREPDKVKEGLKKILGDDVQFITVREGEIVKDLTELVKEKEKQIVDEYREEVKEAGIMLSRAILNGYHFDHFTAIPRFREDVERAMAKAESRTQKIRDLAGMEDIVDVVQKLIEIESVNEE